MILFGKVKAAGSYLYVRLKIILYIKEEIYCIISSSQPNLNWLGGSFWSSSPFFNIVFWLFSSLVSDMQKQNLKWLNLT